VVTLVVAAALALTAAAGLAFVLWLWLSREEREFAERLEELEEEIDALRWELGMELGKGVPGQDPPLPSKPEIGPTRSRQGGL
jgi:hypothetical protein